MGLKSVDGASGDERYNPWYLLVIALVVCTVGGSFFFFAVIKPRMHARAARVQATADTSRTAKAMMAQEPPSVTDERDRSEKYYQQVGKLSGVGRDEFMKAETDDGEVSNTTGRFSRELNSERLDRLGRSAAAPGGGGNSDVFIPGQYSSGGKAARDLPPVAGGSGTVRGGGGGPPVMRRITPISWSDDPGSSGGGSPLSNLLSTLTGQGGAGGNPVTSPLAALKSAQSALAQGAAGGFGAPAGGNDGADPMVSMAQSLGLGGGKKELYSNDATTRRARELSANSVPTGTRLNVVLLNNVISSSIRQRVWAITTQELIFRRQVQLPAGVMLGGWADSKPVRDQLDVTFDIMVFPDGTELKLRGFAVNGFNPLYPGVEGMRGLIDKYVEPPMWTEFMPVLMEFVVGYTDLKFPENTVVVANSSTQPFDERTQINKGINSAAQRMRDRVLFYLERYAPYVHLRKGMSFAIELESTVDFSGRQLAARSYDDLLDEVEKQSERTAAQASQPVPSASEFLGMGSKSPNGLRDSLRSAAAMSAIR